MPVTLYPFLPTQDSPPFEFQPTLDGISYRAEVRWNTFGQRWYITLFTVDGTRVFTQALTSSQPAVDLQSINWENGRVYIVGIVPWVTLGFRVGETMEITVRNCNPDAYNGHRLRALSHDLNLLSYPLAVPPGDVLSLGQGSYDIDLAGGYFKQSTLTYRNATRQFEVFSP